MSIVSVDLVWLWAHWVMDLALFGVSRWVGLWVLGHW